MKPKIIVFSTAYHPLIGGAEISIQEVVKRLQNRFDFYILTHRANANLPKRELSDGATILRLGFGTVLDRWFIFPFLTWRRARQIVNESQAPVLLWSVMVSYASIGAYFLKIMQPRLPLILTLQEGDSEEYLRTAKYGLINFWWRRFLAVADEVTAISTYLGEYAKRQGYLGRIRVISNGVDVGKFQNPYNKVQTPKESLITVSRLVPKNGIDILIRAVAEVKKSVPDIQCNIIGDGPERKNLEKLAAGLGLNDTVHFLGEISHEKVPVFLRSASVFVRPSRSEGMGNSFVEALAAGLPVIGTAVGGIPDIIQDRRTGLMARVDDSEDLAEKIKMLLNDQALSEKLAAEGRQKVKEKFGWDLISESYASLFSDELNIQKRILLITGLFPPDIGGPATYSKFLIEELPLRGIGVRLAYFGKVRHFPPVVRHVWFLFIILWRSRGVNLLFAQDPVSVGLPTMLAAKIFRKKIILKIVGDYAWEQGVQRWRVKELLDDFIKKSYGGWVWFFKLVERWVADHAADIIVPSEYLKRVVIRWGVDAEKIVVIPNAHVSSFDKNPEVRGKSDHPIILSAGRLTPWKGMRELIEIMPGIREKIPNAELWIVGDGPEQGRLQDQIKGSGLEESVKLLGKKSHLELGELLGKSEIFALNTGYEGFSHIILEAMAAGLPIITTLVGGNPELVRDGIDGFLVSFQDNASLLDKIILLLQDQALREGLGRNAMERAKEFSLDRMLTATADFLQSPRVLMISTDKNILRQNSEAHDRMRLYAGIFRKLEIVVTGSGPVIGEGNLNIYPTGFKSALLGRVGLYKTVSSLCRKRRPDILSVQSPDEIGLIAYFAARRFHIPFQLQIHTDIFSPWYRSAGRKEWIRYHIARFLIPRADCIRVVSERIRRSVDQVLLQTKSPTRRGRLSLQQRITVLPIYTDVSKFINATPDPSTGERFRSYKFRMIAIGRFMEKEKNFSMLIEMMRDFVKICPDALLVLVGDGQDMKNYELRIKNYGLEENVILESWRNDLPSFLKSFDLFLLSSNYEGWGRVVIEAMAAGLPVVMTDVGLAGEVVKDGENGIVAPVADQEVIRKACVRLYQDPDLRIRLGRTGQAAARSICPEGGITEYLEKYQQNWFDCVDH